MEKEVIEKFELFVSEQFKEVQQRKDLTNEQKLEAYFTLKNIYKFLNDYDKNIQILQKNANSQKFEREK